MTSFPVKMFKMTLNERIRRMRGDAETNKRLRNRRRMIRRKAKEAMEGKRIEAEAVQPAGA